MSGRKVAGCCSHVAAVIYYFGYAKHKQIILPAEGLNNILIDIQGKTLPNNPIYFRNKRRKKENVSSSSDTSLSTDETDSDENCSKCKKSIENKQKENISSEWSVKQKYDSEKILLQMKVSKKNQKSNDQNLNESGSIVLEQYKLKDFKNHVPNWSAITEYKGIRELDTCTIDYHLLSLWYF